MEVRPAEEMPEEGPEEDIENGEVEPLVSQVEESVPPDFLALLSRCWIWVVAFLFGLSAVSVALLLVLTSREEGPAKGKLEMGLHEVSASLPIRAL